jgi:hypothetical protein
VFTKANDEDAITGLASVTEAHDKLLLFFIAKRRTERVEHSQLGDPEGYQPIHSPLTSSGSGRSSLTVNRFT